MKFPHRMARRHSFPRGHKFPSKSSLQRADKFDGWQSHKDGRTLVRVESLPVLFARMGKDPLWRGIWERIIGDDLPYDFTLTGKSPSDVLDNLESYDSWHPCHCQHPMKTSVTIGGEMVEIEYPCTRCPTGEDRMQPFEWFHPHWLRCHAFYLQIKSRAESRYRTAIINCHYEKMTTDDVRYHLSSIDNDGRYDDASLPLEFALANTREVRWFPPCCSDSNTRV